MSDDKTGGPAFPPMYNLTLRDYFAAKAMQAMVGNYRFVTHNDDEWTTMTPNPGVMLDTNHETGQHEGAADIAADAYAIADAMLAARKEDK